MVSEQQAEAAIKKLRLMIDAAENSNQAGEDAVVAAAASLDMLAALRLHKAWHDSEKAGPDYGGQTRDTHPDGECIWRAWWNMQLDLCDRATVATDTAIARAEGRQWADEREMEDA